MGVEAMFVHDIVVVRPGSKAGRGADAVPDWGTAERTCAVGWVTQQNTRDIRSTGSGDIGDWLLLTSATTDVRPGDRIEWSGLTFAVAGRPLPAWDRSAHHHTEAQLKLVEG